MLSSGESTQFLADPLAFLRASASRDDYVSVDLNRAILSKDPDGIGSVAVFGAPQVQQVLSDAATFRMPVSAAIRHELPAELVELNRAVFSMSGPDHRERKRAITHVLATAAMSAGGSDQAVVGPFDTDDAGDDLMEWTRRIAGHAAQALVLGEFGGGIDAITRLYFDLRRQYNARASEPRRRSLISVGLVLHDQLAQRVGLVLQRPEKGGILGLLVQSARQWSTPVTHNELVAHANILITAGSEPVASTLAWLLLGLTQRPALSRQLRNQIRTGRYDLLDNVVNESVRLAPANAVMARIATRDVSVGGRVYVGGTEMLVSPFVAHRDRRVFAAPDAFRPGRWKGATQTVGAFDYFPFGGGLRSCPGRHLAMSVLRQVIADCLRPGDLGLPTASEVDWRMDVTLAPWGAPRLGVVESPDKRGGRLLGPARAMVGLPV